MSSQSFVCSSRSDSAEEQSSAHRRYLPVKAAVEWIIAAVLLVCLAPVIAVCAVLVKMSSPGPAFYCQMRLGRYGRPYRMYKIRSMKHNCEAATGPVWSAGKDSRVTRIGRILRDTHLDELPQLWNVLTGEMGLIGPRPERPEIVDRLQNALPRYRRRLLVRPGVTGLAQMRLPPDCDLESVRRKLAFDFYYIQHMGPWLDVRIALSTVMRFAASVADSLSHSLIKPEGDAAEEGIAGIEFLPPKQPTVQSA